MTLRPVRHLLLLAAIGTGLKAAALDLTKAVLVAPPNLSKPELKALALLVDEVEKRAQVRWEVRSAWPADGSPVVAVGPAAHLKDFAGPHAGELATRPVPASDEGFHIFSATQGAPAAFVIGNDARGVLFGVGRLLRSLRMTPGQISLPNGFNLESSPHFPLRGHQLGYRPKTHSYDAWDLPIWEQYIRDLVVFGCNAVELIPPRSDDDATSPHFPLPPLEMLPRMAKLLDDYGLDVWLWYPALDKDYADPKTVEAALIEWAQIFKLMPRLDAVFVPGGDPGHTRPRDLLPMLEKQAANLHRFHPQAQLWVSPQGFTQEWLDEFIALLNRQQPAWLHGIVFGPQVRVSLPELRRLVPWKYPIRDYPDITHCRQCQYPVPDWDTAFAITEGREGINPRPTQMAAIFRYARPYTVGFISYSEGCNDDVNKAVWSALGWDPDANVPDILRDYSRYFIGERYSDDFAQGLLALEKNWNGPLLANEPVNTTLQKFQALERAAAPRDKLNWRFQQALYRAYYDAYTRSRLVYETGLEERALEILRAAPTHGSLHAMNDADAALDRALTQRVATDWRARIFELAEALFQSIRMQLSVEKYQAIGVDRGANLDTLDYPLNSRSWLKEQFARLRKLPTEAERLTGLQEILHWTDPGPGGFYDDLGNLATQPHLQPGRAYERDPAFLDSPHVGFEEGDVVDEPDEKPAGALRYSWLNHTESMQDAPLRLRYTGLDPQARYQLRVVYAGDAPKKKIRLTAGDGMEIHPLMLKPWPIKPVEFAVPAAAIKNGELTLNWTREPGLGGNGRGCQVSEVWLIKRRD